MVGMHAWASALSSEHLCSSQAVLDKQIKLRWAWNALWAVTQRVGMMLSALIRTTIVEDRRFVLEERAKAAQRAAASHNWQELHAIT